MIIPLKYVKIETRDEDVDSIAKEVKISTSLYPNNSHLTTVREYEDIIPDLSKILLYLVHGYTEEELLAKLPEDYVPEEYEVDPRFCISKKWNKKSKILELGDNPFREGTKLWEQFGFIELGISPWDQSKNGVVTIPMMKTAFDRGSIILEE